MFYFVDVYVMLNDDVPKVEYTALEHNINYKAVSFLFFFLFGHRHLDITK